MLQPKSLLYWAPRVLALATAAFLSLFALDVFGAASSVGETLLALGMHLVPAALVLVALAIAWRWEAAGGLLFILGGVGYVAGVDAAAHPDWVAVIAGPLWLTGGLFLLGALRPGRSGDRGHSEGTAISASGPPP